MSKLIEIAVKRYKDRLEQHYMHEGDPETTPYLLHLDGTNVMRWEYYNVQRKIAAAACAYGDYIVTGVRHYCPIMTLQIDAIGSKDLIEYCGGRDNIVQGFVCQYGFFLTREEAWVIAKAANQIINVYEEGTLYSECYI